MQKTRVWVCVWSAVMLGQQPMQINPCLYHKGTVFSPIIVFWNAKEQRNYQKAASQQAFCWYTYSHIHIINVFKENETKGKEKRAFDEVDCHDYAIATTRGAPTLTHRHSARWVLSRLSVPLSALSGFLCAPRIRMYVCVLGSGLHGKSEYFDVCLLVCICVYFL